MTRYLNLTLIAVMIGVAAVVYGMKYEAETVAEKVRALKREVDREREAVALLKAEWSMLNQPARLQELVARHNDHMGLAPLDPVQIGSLAEIPWRNGAPGAATATIDRPAGRQGEDGSR